MNLKPFEPIVAALTKKFKIRNNESEDISQELIIKLIELLPRLETIPLLEAKKLCRFSLSKHAIDLYNKEKKHCISDKPLNYSYENNDVNSDVCTESSSYISAAVDSIVFNYESDVAVDVFESRELQRIVMEWAKNQTTDICQLVSEMIEPTPIIKLAYLALQKGTKKETDIEFVSPWKLVKVLNMPERTWFKARNELRKYLLEIGYEPLAN